MYNAGFERARACCPITGSFGGLHHRTSCTGSGFLCLLGGDGVVVWLGSHECERRRGFIVGRGGAVW